MKKKDYKKIGRNVIELQIQALKKLKSSINKSFNDAIEVIVKCQSKVIICGVGKSFRIASKISSTMTSVGTPSFALSAGDCSHGDLGCITKKDVLILISYSGETKELKNIIQYANRNRIKLIGIVSKKNSILYKASDIKIYIPEVKESGHGIVPTSSTTTQLAIGDALSIASMEYKKFSKLDFKKFHPAGTLGAKLRTAEDLMLTGKNIPFVNEDLKMKLALKIISKKKLGLLIVKSKQGLTKGIVVDGDIKRAIQKNSNVENLKIKNIMTKEPISIAKNTLAAKALDIMSNKKITSLCIHSEKNKKKTIGILHIHNILQSNIH
ncbi:KpsF/GutQ family sugar-phosphate isomerase [Candidatus Pelagibacter sp.]|nr:KpsF/GutQ family sugar-phosphate isomerase [Candidatus Pelagibacter sp.]